MDKAITLHFTVADIISVLNGLLVFLSVLLAGSDSWYKRQWAWGLGGSVQLMLVLFGWLTERYGFFLNIIPASAFAWNFYRGFYPRTAKPKDYPEWDKLIGVSSEPKVEYRRRGEEVELPDSQYMPGAQWPDDDSDTEIHHR